MLVLDNDLFHDHILFKYQESLASSNMVRVQTNKYLSENDDGSINVKSKGVLKPYWVFRNDTPTLVSCEKENITRHLPSSHPTEKIDFNLSYDDGSLLNFIPVGKTRLHYRGDLKVSREINRGIAATKSRPTFIGGYGKTTIKVSIPSPVYDYIVDEVIASMKMRKDVHLDQDWENRFRSECLEEKEGYTTFRAKMHHRIPDSHVEDVTMKMKEYKMSACGLGRLGVRLIRIHNPNQQSLWNLRFTIHRLHEAELSTDYD
jgi:hypothetical protein